MMEQAAQRPITQGSGLQSKAATGLTVEHLLFGAIVAVGVAMPDVQKKIYEIGRAHV